MNLNFVDRSRGRRHSVAVPLIPPPDGETFEGGYRIERNPITGGARLVPPPSGLTVFQMHKNHRVLQWILHCNFHERQGLIIP
jgi:hypothetical protein